MVKIALIIGVLGSVVCAAPQKEKFHLYLLAGQSNMAGRGAVEEQDKTAHPRVLMLNEKGEWSPAVEPLHFDKPKVAGVGPGLAFGRAMAEANPEVTIGLIPCAVGGTPLASWQPGVQDKATKTTPWNTAIARAKLALKDGTFKGILWHQGESDANYKEAITYGNRLEQTLGKMRDELGVDDAVIVVGTLGPFKAEQDEWTKLINAELMGFKHRFAYCGVASAEGLTHKGDNLHFDASSARELGRRYAKEVLRLQAQTKPLIVKVWEQGLPDGKPLAVPEEKKVARTAKTSDPTLMVYLPEKAKANGTAVVICPGGGYNIHAIEKEGECIARWFNEMGVAAAVLKYRLKDYKQPSPLLDAQQAMRIVRISAAEWGVDPKRVGIMGFSAGGHLAGAASNSAALAIPDARYEKFASIDCKPDFSILIYSVLPQPGDKWVKEMYTPIVVSEKTPPAFLAHTKDDRVPAQLSEDYAAALRKHNVPVELFLAETGGHGYGLGQSGGGIARWPDECAKWMKTRGLLGK